MRPANTGEKVFTGPRGSILRRAAGGAVFSAGEEQTVPAATRSRGRRVFFMGGVIVMMGR